MEKAGRIVLLVATIFAIAGANNITLAQTSLKGIVSIFQKPKVQVTSGFDKASTCASISVSSKLCEELNSKTCMDSASSNEPVKQVQGAVATAPTEGNTTIDTTTNPVALPTMSPLNSQYAPDNAVLDSDKIFSLINTYRASVGLAPFQKDDRVCELAQTRSNEIIGEIASGVLHSGLYNRNLPYWIWENAKYGSNEEGTVAWWLASPIHHQSIVGDYQYSCVKCTGSYCSELFTSFVPKNAIAAPTTTPEETQAPQTTTAPTGPVGALTDTAAQVLNSN